MTTKAKPFAVFAHYFESGHRYEIARTQTFAGALTIGELATAQLTDSERKAFNYVIDAVTPADECERVKTQRDILQGAIRAACDVIKREGDCGLDSA